MKKNLKVILDIGSSKIVCMAATKLSATEFSIKAVGISLYSGFDENGFFEPKKLKEAVSSAIAQVENKLQIRVKEVTVGVPSVFCTLFSNESKLIFNSRKKIDAYDVNDLIKKAYIYGNFIDKKLVGRNILSFYLDDLVLLYNPIGAIADRISAVVSFTYVSKYFLNTMDGILNALGIRARYANASELEANFINSNYAVGGYSLVIDIGHITSTFMIARGKGLAFCREFALGSGYFSADLSQVFNIKYGIAELILAKMNLRLEFNSDATYTASDVSINASKANEVVKARIEQFAEYIVKCYNEYNQPIPESTPIVLCGGGLTYLRGGAEWLSNYLGKDVTVYSSPDPTINKNEFTSCYGIMQHALNSLPQSTSAWERIKKFFGGKK